MNNCNPYKRKTTRLWYHLQIYNVFSIPILSLHVVFSTSNVYVEYEESGFRLIHNPTIYAVTPPPDPTTPNLDMELFQKTQSAVLDWKKSIEHIVVEENLFGT